MSHWPPEVCGTEECVEAHTKVDVMVDIPAFRALLQVGVISVGTYWAGKAVTELT